MKGDEVKVFEFELGGVWEFNNWEMTTNLKTAKNSGSQYLPCKHAKKCEGEPGFIIPYTASIENEAGFNNTGICAECVEECLKIVKLHNFIALSEEESKNGKEEN